ncbi:methyltransferase-like protein 4, partial [Plakobranchus ocellatus]
DQIYDLVVLDPPWTNKSVKRKKSYLTQTENDLVKVPISQLCNHGSLVCVWVTNNSRLVDFVKETLFPAWSVSYCATWIWVKVTLKGEPICTMSSSHKKPYEQIMIGRYEEKTVVNMNQRSSNRRESKDCAVCETCGPNINIHSNEDFEENFPKMAGKNEIEQSGSELFPSKTERNHSHYPRRFFGKDNPCECFDSTVSENGASLTNNPVETDIGRKNQAFPSQVDIPHHFVLVSVPCAFHSKKPPLGGE